MMEEMRSTLGKISEANPLLALAASGLSPAAMKQLVIQTLDPYFTDKEMLSKLSADFLSTEAINVRNLYKVRSSLGPRSLFFARLNVRHVTHSKIRAIRMMKHQRAD
jgi:hypothetical protein